MGFRYNHSSDGTIIRHQDEMKMKHANNLNNFFTAENRCKYSIYMTL